VPQDIVGVKEGAELRQPRIKIAVKATKFKNSFLILGQNEVESEDRRSDVYILVRVDLPDDHLMRLAKEVLPHLLATQSYFASYKSKMLNLGPIPCEIAGFCRVEELEKVSDPKTLGKILGTSNPKGYRYVKATGKLHRSLSDWEDIARSI